ncbi:hypothetical protein [Tenacibaculum agarivorans]|uniref:hypothetical protein n=1 Tax=Tenacibaculum agarivorans TaxID=1908389 RepID=UPI00094BB7AA|nr:hypothetical protein [Tenacibaculum agarivorans]
MIRFIKRKININVLMLIFLLLSTQSILGQKVDLDKERASIRFIQLPTDPILNSDDRTYTVASNISDFIKRINISGFTKLEKEGTIKIRIDVDELLSTPVKVSKIVEENKDKEGKVINTSTFYTANMELILKGRWFVSITNGKSYNYPIEYSKKLQSKKTSSLDHTKKYFEKNQEALIKNFRKEFMKEQISKLNYYLNASYGYRNERREEVFWILDSEKNPDYKGYQSQFKRIKEVFGRIKAKQPITSTHTQYLDNFEEYFNQLVKKYPLDKRKHRKMRYASYYNLAKLYYNFDMLDKAIEYANKLIENDYDKSDGKRIIKKANKLKKLFELNQVTSTHFPVQTVDKVVYKQEDKIVSDKANSTIPVKQTPKTKPSSEIKKKNNYYTLTNNIDKDNEIVKSIITDIEEFYMTYDKTGLVLEKGYLIDKNRIVGKEYYSLGQDKFTQLLIVTKDNQINSVKLHNTEIELNLNDKKRIEKLEYLNGKYQFKRDASGRIIDIVHNTYYDKIENISFNRDVNGLLEIKKKIKKFGPTIITHKENTPTKHSSIYTEFDKKNKIKIKIENDFTLKNDNHVVLNKNYTYHTGEKKKTSRDFIYNNFNKLIKFEKRTSDHKNIHTLETKNYEYLNNELVKTATKMFIDNQIQSTDISISKDITSKSENAPEYEWREGIYRLNSNNELISIVRDGKYKEKTNGVWSDWKFQRM